MKYISYKKFFFICIRFGVNWFHYLNLIKMKNFLIFLFPVVLILGGCTPGEKKISESQLRDFAVAEGNRIAMETQQLLGSTLKKTIQQQGIPEALKYCNLNAYPLVDSIEQKYSVIIKRASTDIRNPLDKPDDAELEFILAFQDSLASGKTLQPMVEVHEKEIHFVRPIILNDEVCLNCHGRIGTDIPNENYQVIKALYPDDQATGHVLGDLRGIWSIRFSRNDLTEAIRSDNQDQ